MAIHDILAKPQWQALAKRPGFAAISAAAIEATDGFFAFIVQHRLHNPTPGDIRNWAASLPSVERALALDGLEEVFSVCEPNFLRMISEARREAPDARKVAGSISPTQVEEGQVRRPAYEAKDWDPIAPGPLGFWRKRAVSIVPTQLPAEYQDALRRAADGLPGREPRMLVPARSIVLRMREKLCQYVWCCRQNGAPDRLCSAGIDR